MRFPSSQKEFPIQCFRTDLQVGEFVIVRISNGSLRCAEIMQLRYLNWTCRARIECKKSESYLDSSGNINLSRGYITTYGISTHEILIKSLKSSNWVPVKSKQRIYIVILAQANKSKIGYIFVRKNGIDLQIIPRDNTEEIYPYSRYESSLGEGKRVRHSLAHTTFNLFEGILRFSNSFVNNEDNLDRYFVPQGKRDKRAEGLQSQLENKKANNKVDLGGDYPSDMKYGYHWK